MTGIRIWNAGFLLYRSFYLTGTLLIYPNRISTSGFNEYNFYLNLFATVNGGLMGYDFREFFAVLYKKIFSSILDDTHHIFFCIVKITAELRNL